MPLHIEVLPDEVIANRWRILKLIGVGGFSAIFQTQDIISNEICALKVEPTTERPEGVIKMEVAVLLELRGKSIHACAFFGCGRIRGRMNFVAMTLVGQNLDELRQQRPTGRFQASTVLRLAIQCVDAIKDVHDAGYLHRDIKPANFAIGRTPIDSRIVYILDFGLARRFRTIEDSDEMRPARESVGFRSTVRYCSFRAHMSADVGRVDDFWSLFYLLIELRTGILPWSTILKDHGILGRMKYTCELSQLVDKEDTEIFAPIDHVLRKLRYEDKPNYDWFNAHFSAVQKKNEYPIEGPFEWENEQENSASDPKT